MLTRDYPGLVEHLVRRTGDRQLAGDLLQDAIVTALAKLDGGLHVSAEVLTSYVFRTALNHLRNHRRRESARRGDAELVDSLPTDPSQSPLDESQRCANARLVRRLLEELPSVRDREILVRYYLDDQDKQQICALFGLSELQFNRVVYRARDRLRALLDRAGVGRFDALALLLFLVSVYPERVMHACGM
jgi:RNA polymerase sigma-70 factor (ECF subfamily)